MRPSTWRFIPELFEYRLVNCADGKIKRTSNGHIRASSDLAPPRGGKGNKPSSILRTFFLGHQVSLQGAFSLLVTYILLIFVKMSYHMH